MAEQASTKEQHVFRLSTLDQGAPRDYHTVAFIYPLDYVHAPAVANRFLSAIRILLSWLPLLAGKLRIASGRNGAVRGHLEIAVSLDMIASFTAKVVNLHATGSNYDYDVLRAQRCPSSSLGIAQFAQLPIKAAAAGAKAFGAQLSIISGGAVVVLQLHRAVADLAAFSQIVRRLTETRELRKLTYDILSSLALQSSAARDLLSGDGGVLPVFDGGAPIVPPGLELGEILTEETVSVVLGFKPAKIDELTKLVNDSNLGADGTARKLPVSAFSVLAALLWRAVVRARMAAGLIHLSDTRDINPPFANSRVSVGVNVRGRLQPELKRYYFGNATVSGAARQSVVALNMPPNAPGLAFTAPIIRDAVGGVTDHSVRREIATIKTKHFSTTDTEAITDTSINPRERTNVNITSWSDAIPDSCNLSLGLGEPSFIRKLTDPTSKEDITIHVRPNTDTKKPTFTTDNTVWEATLTVNATMRPHLLADEMVMKHVKFADGVKYINGRAEQEELGHQLALVQEAEKRQSTEMWRQRNLAIAGPSSAGAGVGGQ